MKPFKLYCTFPYQNLVSLPSWGVHDPGPFFGPWGLHHSHGNQNWWERSDQWLVLAGHFWPQMVPSRWSSRETTSLGYPYCGKHPMFDPALTRSIIRSHDLKGFCIPNSTRSGTGASQTQATQDWNGTLETRDPWFVSTLFLGHELKVWYPNKRNTLSKAIFREVLQNCLIFLGGALWDFFYDSGTQILSTTKMQNAKRTFWNARSERRGVLVALWIPEASQSFFCSLQKDPLCHIEFFNNVSKSFRPLLLALR